VRVTVHLRKESDESYGIQIDAGVFSKIPKDLRTSPLGNKYAVITDSHVRGLLGTQLVDGLQDEGLEASLMDFPAGEESKSLQTVEALTRLMLKNGLDRKSAVIALGGGVVGDVAGFVAAIYMRGIPYIQIPTTLMAQVDSSIGGKTAVDLSEGKNLLGTFHQPKRVYIDPTVLSTLPRREVRNGMAEIIKYGVIYDRALFEYLEANAATILGLDEQTLTHVISRACQIKSEIVQNDEREENRRAVLNYGHTLGHAEEICSLYPPRLHGEAVAIGMNYAGSLAVQKGLWRDKDLTRQNALIESLGLPLHSTRDPKALVNAMRYDKKAEGGRIMFVLPARIGQMATLNGQYRIPVSEDELFSVLRSVA
jgi:3-dehydroquinate synthase